MSVATEITRIQTDRNTIRAKLVELGMAQNTDGLDELAAAVEGIENQGAVSATVQEGDTYTIPRGYQPTIRKLMERGALKGVSDPDPNSLEDNVLNISQDYCRVMTTLDNMGVLG